jgi:hypothetical protein
VLFIAQPERMEAQVTAEKGDKERRIENTAELAPDPDLTLDPLLTSLAKEGFLIHSSPLDHCC